MFWTLSITWICTVYLPYCVLFPAPGAQHQHHRGAHLPATSQGSYYNAALILTHKCPNQSRLEHPVEGWKSVDTPSSDAGTPQTIVKAYIVSQVSMFLCNHVLLEEMAMGPLPLQDLHKKKEVQSSRWRKMGKRLSSGSWSLRLENRKSSSTFWGQKAAGLYVGLSPLHLSWMSHPFSGIISLQLIKCPLVTRV